MASNKVLGMGMMVAAVVGVVMVLQLSGVEGVINCNTVQSNLVICIGYLRSGRGTPPANCCAGVRSLASRATTTADRRAACSCLKQAATRVPNVKPAAISALPGACGVRLPYTITINTNCNTIK